MRCRTCRGAIDRGVVCFHCYAGVWPPLSKTELMAEVESFRKFSEPWQRQTSLEILRDALRDVDAENLPWFNEKYPPKVRKVEPSNPMDYLDKDPGPDPTMPPSGVSSPQPNLDLGIPMPERLPKPLRRR